MEKLDLKKEYRQLYNPSANPVDLSDMSLTDSSLNPRRWVFPPGVILPSQQYLVVRFNPDNTRMELLEAMR